MKLNGKVALVTGASRGIGAAIASKLASLGCDVAINYAGNIQKAEETLNSVKAYGVNAQIYQANVANYEEVEAMTKQIIKDFGHLDIIINNAGISEFSPITETSVEDFDKILSINLRPVFITSRTLALHRKSQAENHPYGRIINICSTRYLMSEPGSESYAASKGGIYSLTHALALSLADFHITVNCISPGWIQTNDYERLRPEDHAQHPSRRVGKPEDIARMCLFLCQEENDFINGQNIIIDGGMTKKMIYIE